jgi:hypothetical protein
MALDPLFDAYVHPYKRQALPDLEESQKQYLDSELRKIEATLKDVADLTPQAADQAPTLPRKGMQRYAITPWDPGSGVDKWYYYTGSAWTLL